MVNDDYILSDSHLQSYSPRHILTILVVVKLNQYMNMYTYLQIEPKWV